MIHAFITSLLFSAPSMAENAEPCHVRSAEEGLHALSTSLEAYAQLDAELFARSLSSAEDALACPDRALMAEERARLWLARGLGAWLARDEGAVVDAFARALGAHPALKPGPDLVPEGSLLLEILEQARADTPNPAREPPAPVPPAAPTLAVADTVPLGGEPWPRASWALLGTGLASAAASGAALAVSQRAEDRFWTTGARAEAERAYRLQRGAVFTAYGAAGVSLGLVTSAVVVGRW